MLNTFFKEEFKIKNNTYLLFKVNSKQALHEFNFIGIEEFRQPS